MNQSLELFQAAFGLEPVRFAFSHFAKDGAFSTKTIKALKASGLDAIYLKPLSSGAKAKYEASFVTVGDEGAKVRTNMGDFRARLVALCWVDKAGELVGSDAEITQLPTALVEALYEESQRLNHLDTSGVEEAGKG